MATAADASSTVEVNTNTATATEGAATKDFEPSWTADCILVSVYLEQLLVFSLHIRPIFSTNNLIDK